MNVRVSTDMAPSRHNVIFLTGAPASGKTTLGRRLAERLGEVFVDLDEEISAAAGLSIPEMFATRGEGAFRQMESETLAAVVRRGAAGVVALGGGTLLRPENRVLCESAGTVLCLEAPDESELARRIGAAAGSRPLGDRAKERAAHYASFANRVEASFEVGPSLVVVGRGLALPILSGRRIVADGNVARIYRERLPEPLAVVPSGEENKTIGTVGSLWHAFAAAGLGRRDSICAVGGGVTGDLAGFAAATWMRGMDWINVPTTLLSMVDASTGGKTGCDLPEGKNLAGAFHSPKLVLVDVGFLDTLSQRLLSDGRAEMIKHELIGGRDLSAARTAPSGAPTAAEVAANLAVKVGIVKEDPFERLGRRILLNCGHTVAHAVERATDYAVSHGSAVAVGCVEEARIAVKLGLAGAGWPDEVAASFAAAGLPTAMPRGLSLGELVPLMRGDKKRRGGTVVFALPCGWGDVRGVPIDLTEGVWQKSL